MRIGQNRRFLKKATAAGFEPAKAEPIPLHRRLAAAITKIAGVPNNHYRIRPLRVRARKNFHGPLRFFFFAGITRSWGVQVLYCKSTRCHSGNPSMIGFTCQLVDVSAGSSCFNSIALPPSSPLGFAVVTLRSFLIVRTPLLWAVLRRQRLSVRSPFQSARPSSVPIIMLTGPSSHQKHVRKEFEVEDLTSNAKNSHRHKAYSASGRHSLTFPAFRPRRKIRRGSFGVTWSQSGSNVPEVCENCPPWRALRQCARGPRRA